MSVASWLTPQLFLGQGFDIKLFIVRNSLILLAILSSMLASAIFIRQSESESAKNRTLLVVAFALMFLLLEFILGVIPIISGGGSVYTAKNWFNYYWHENSLGYRDPEPVTIDRADLPNILVVGDSYVAGHGLRTVDERFSDILRIELESEFDVFNLGKCGSNIPAEFTDLKSFPVKPDIVILSHNKNDIQDVMPRNELMRFLDASPEALSKYPKWDGSEHFLTRHSALLNFIGFLNHRHREASFFEMMITRNGSVEALLNDPEAKFFYMTYYLNETLMRQHVDQLTEFSDWCKQNDSQFLVVLFPATNDDLLNLSEKVVNKPLSAHFAERSIQYVDLYPIFERISETDRVVSRFDPHPSAELNKLVADTLTIFLRQH